MKRMLVMLILVASAVPMLSSLGNREASPSEREQAVLTVRPGHEFALLRGTDLLTGNEVNASVLTGSAVTVITIWATTCPACIVKLPDLAVLEDELPEGVSIIGICQKCPVHPRDALCGQYGQTACRPRLWSQGEPVVPGPDCIPAVRKL